MTPSRTDGEPSPGIGNVRREPPAAELLRSALRHDLRAGPGDILALCGLLRARAISADVMREQVERRARETLALADELAALLEDSEACAPTSLELAPLLTDCVDGLWPDAREAGIVATLPDTMEAVHVRADPALLARLLRLLLQRAIASSPPGTQARTTLTRQGQRCTICIRLLPHSPLAFAAVDSDRPAGVFAQRAMRRLAGAFERQQQHDATVWRMTLPTVDPP